MEPRTKHTIKDRSPYLHLLPKAEEKTYVLKKSGAKLEDTIYFIKFVLPLIAYQTERLAEAIGGDTPYEFAKRAFQWIYDHIEYRRDARGIEQVKSPQRTIFDGYGDCEDMQILACGLLLNKKIPFKIRTTVYDEDIGVQHIYPFAIIASRDVIMDCVAQRFNYEVPYLKKIDYELPYINYDKKMELQFLNGTPEPGSSSPKRSIDADDLLEGFSEEEIGELGKKGKLKAKIHNAAKNVQAKAHNAGNKIHNAGQKIKNSKAMQAAKKGFHLVNRVNPVTTLLRTGILIGLKTNMFKIAESLRYTYLTPQQAQAQHLDANKLNRLTGIRQKLEKIFYGAGGLAENFKKSILTGKGNHDKIVPLLAGLGAMDYSNYNQSHSPLQILGHQTYNSEIGSVEGFGELGVAATAAVAAATAALSAIAALIKNVGSLKKNSQGGDGSNDSADQSSGSNDVANSSNATNSADPSNTSSTSSQGADSSENQQQDNTPAFTDKTSTNQSQNDTGSGSDPKSNGGGAANKSTKSADTSAATNTAEGSTNTQGQGNEDTANSTGEDGTSNSSNSSDSTDGANPSGSENGENTASSARGKSTNAAATKTVKEESMALRAMNWAKENKLAAAGAVGVALIVAGGITYGLIKLFSKDKDKKDKADNKEEHVSSVAGLPHKKPRRFQSDRFKVMPLK